MKVAGVFSSVARGVSQQVFQHRLEGQHERQTNLISDPVVGLARRKGSVTKAVIGGVNLADISRYRNYDFLIGEKHYSLLYPTQAVSHGSPLSAYMLLDKGSMQALPLQGTGSGGAQAVSALASGLTAITTVGDVVVMAGNTQHQSFTESGDLVEGSRVGVIWVRAGNFNRRYEVKLTYVHQGQQGVLTASYTTPSATYSGTLDTSDLDPESESYVSDVNNRVNSYNSAVTNWMSTAAQQTTPDYIAKQLSHDLNTKLTGISSGIVSYMVGGNHIAFQDYSPTPVVKGISGTDGGDNSSIRVVWQEVKSVDELPAAARRDMVIAVRPKDGADAFYVKAHVPVYEVGGWGQAKWTEYTNKEITPSSLFVLGVVHQNKLLVSTNPADLNAAVPGLKLPLYGTRQAGDDDTNPVPAFFSRTISYLGNFQDRLVVGTGTVLAMSGPGDYFNFFRGSILTVKDSDAIEVYAVGADDDIIRHSVVFDRSIVFFGDRQQYTIDGRQAITASTTAIMQSSAHEDATDAPPIASGDQVFYAKRREGSVRLYQMQLGDLQDTSRVSDVSLQLSDYIQGRPIQLLGTSSPDMVLLRTDAHTRTVHVFRYIDANGERILDSWSDWLYDTALGPIVGMSAYKDQVLFYHSKKSSVIVTTQPLMSGLSDTPYLDGQVPLTSPLAPYFRQLLQCCVAVDNTHEAAYLHGELRMDTLPGSNDGIGRAALLADFPDLKDSQMWVGARFNSYVTLTSPVLRTMEGLPITAGRLTVTKVTLSYRDTVGMQAVVITDRGPKEVLLTTEKRLGSKTSTVLHQPTTGKVPVYIGREAGEYTLTVMARDWKPMTLTGVSWVGQYFNNTRP